MRPCPASRVVPHPTPRGLAPAGEPWDAVQRRRGWSPPVNGVGGGAPVEGWRDRPAVRAGLLALAVVLAVMAAASAWPGASGGRDAGPPPAATAGGGAGRDRAAYAFAP